MYIFLLRPSLKASKEQEFLIDVFYIVISEALKGIQSKFGIEQHKKSRIITKKWRNSRLLACAIGTVISTEKKILKPNEEIFI